MTTFHQLNHGWNAEPNAPDPRVVVEGADVVVTFLMNPFQFPEFDPEDVGRLRFISCRRYRLGSINDEGWYRGQCRFSKVAPRWGEFYEVGGDLRLAECPDDWVSVSSEAEGPRHFLFYFRDEEFECDASDWSFEVLRAEQDRSTRTAAPRFEFEHPSLSNAGFAASASFQRRSVSFDVGQRMNCAHCQFPERTLWTFDRPPEFEEVVAKHFMGLFRCPKCEQLWCGVPYEPFASFWFWIAWPYSEAEWRAMIEKENGRVLAEWHEAVLVERHAALPHAEKEVVEAWRRRASGFTPIDHRQPRFIRQSSEVAAFR